MLYFRGCQETGVFAVKRMQRLRRVDLQVSLLTAVIVIISCTGIYFLTYNLTHADMIHSLQERVLSMSNALEPDLGRDSFLEIRCAGDETRQSYLRSKKLLESVKEAAGVRYLYTAMRTEQGEYIYLVDGLPSDSEDFRHAGDPIEPEIIPELERALQGEAVLPDEIKSTSWGYIFISYLPVHVDGQVVGVLGVEFDAQHQYETYRLFRLATPLVIIASCLIAGLVAMTLFRRLSNPTFKDLATTDFLTNLRNRNAFELTVSNLGQPRTENMAVVAVDLDGLKAVNDTYGHSAGDAYIRACARVLESLAERQDRIFRIGGDEFALIFQEKGPDEIETLLEKLQERAGAGSPDVPVPLSFSAGYAFFAPLQDGNLLSTLDRADAMMYARKRERHKERKE